MYGVGADFNYTAGDPVSPIGPDLPTQDDWWFRGPAYRALAPSLRPNGTVAELPAGGTVELEIACNVAWTRFRPETETKEGSALSACPNNPGAYHSGDPDSSTIDDDLLSGCAIGIADVDNIEDVTMDNLAIISVQSQCVRQKVTSFDIPKRLPPCSGDKCICAWFWLANNGTANFYMTGFDCTVTDSPSNALPIVAPQDPVFCAADNSTCMPTKGAKRPLYAYNTPSNVPWYDNNNRPGYHSLWSFEDGAQEDIYAELDEEASTSSASKSSVSTATAAATALVVAQLAVVLPSSAATSANSSGVNSTSTATPTRRVLSTALAAAKSTITRNSTSALATPTALVNSTSLPHNASTSTRRPAATLSTTLVNTTLPTTTRHHNSTVISTSTSNSTSPTRTRTRSATSAVKTSLISTTRRVIATTKPHKSTSTGHHPHPTSTRRLTTTRKASKSTAKAKTTRKTSKAKATKATRVYQSTGGTGVSKSTQTARTKITGAGSRVGVGGGWIIGLGLGVGMLLV
ncbi:hypothetical protein BCR35DRAFT_310676 [Leucosporidium creatinivorum]|uniref:Uncharacterized protein n=1 Tax=Leucosporidium creatinivorum TaxID=106004 RepID=A0A1Y2CXK7_9BASI|nr:hypothetical protein BCR35DRAFT_310676 [Leucosporidium creatinivorum]